MKSSSIFEKILFAKIELWAVFVLVIFMLVAFPLFGLLVVQKTVGNTDHPLAEKAFNVAMFPQTVIRILSGDIERVTQPQLLEFDSFSGLKIFRDGFEDTGTLLLSSYNDDKGVSTAKLMELSSGRILHEWEPPVDAIRAETSYHQILNIRKNYATQHPLLLDDGSIVTTSGQGPLARIDACGNLLWTIDRHFHHSIEVAEDGNLYVPIILASPEDHKSMTTEGHRVGPIRDDAIAKVTPDGRILQEWSIKDILERNGYFGLLYGVGDFQSDRTHINDIEPILESDEFVRKGDVLISVRNLSTVFHYRPSSDEIIWLQTGPWLKQHDVDYQGNGVFTIFGNGSADFREVAEFNLYGHSTVWEYDMKSDSVTPFLPLDQADIYTATQGLHRVLDYSRRDTFVEEQNSGLLHRVDENGLIWSFADGQGDGRIGIPHWSRYLTREEADFPWLDDLTCG